ncbi:MAG: hypothetical protein GF401_18350 [Chitinivibrionales bacterium]|nr:hypothetical protein [Chitinivibrionales bacterium]
MSKRCVVFLAILILFKVSYPEKRIPAFPGAEGFGMYAKGGRGGKVLCVTSLDDYDPEKEDTIPGTFRWACEQPGPRIVIFKVSGTIELKAPICISESYITIAGQSAPGDGVCLKNSTLALLGDREKEVTDVIVRYLRVRPGDNRAFIGDTTAPVRTDRATNGNDGVTFRNVHNSIIDHCSVSWGVDENIECIWHSKDVTIQWCISAEGLHKSTNRKGAHSKGLMVGYHTTNVTLHHNLIAHCVDRNPYLPADNEYPHTIDVVNNLVYNWWVRAGIAYPKTNHNGNVNFVGNYYIMGPTHGKNPALPSALTRGFLHEAISARTGYARTRMNTMQSCGPDRSSATACNILAGSMPPKFQRSIISRRMNLS